MDEVEFEASLDWVLDFGKHKGKTLKEVIDTKVTYVCWMWYEDVVPLSKEAEEYWKSKVRCRKKGGGYDSMYCYHHDPMSDTCHNEGAFNYLERTYNQPTKTN